MVNKSGASVQVRQRCTCIYVRTGAVDAGERTHASGVVGPVPEAKPTPHLSLDSVRSSSPPTA